MMLVPERLALGGKSSVLIDVEMDDDVGTRAAVCQLLRPGPKTRQFEPSEACFGNLSGLGSKMLNLSLLWYVLRPVLAIALARLGSKNGPVDRRRRRWRRASG